VRIKASKTLRTAEWAAASKPPKAVADAMAEAGISKILAGHPINVPDKLGQALKKANLAAEE
jgi:hypothetical protein